MPGGSSQAGLMVMLAEPGIEKGTARVNLVEWASTKIKRIVRSSMGAEVSAATTAFEHGDFTRAALAEMLLRDFQLRFWRKGAGIWRQLSVLDARCAFDSLNSDLLPTDRRVAIDVAVLKEALTDEEVNGFVKWVPGPQMVCDGLTKGHPNPVLQEVMERGLWSLKEDPSLVPLRAEARERQKVSKAKIKAEIEEEAQARLKS
jgi:hypothetical protein